MMSGQHEDEGYHEENLVVEVPVLAAEDPERLLPPLGLVVRLNGVERVADFRNVGVIG